MNEPVTLSFREKPFERDEDVAEVPVLLCADQLHELEAEACRRGLTTAELLRRLITRFLADTRKREL